MHSGAEYFPALEGAIDSASREVYLETCIFADDPSGKYFAAFICRDNFRHRRDMESSDIAAIEAARQDILITNAYFFPGDRFRRALMEAKSRGVARSLLGLIGYADH